MKNMVIEVWVETVLPGKMGEVRDSVREWKGFWQSHGVNARGMTPHTGKMGSKFITVLEFDSYADREKFWGNLPDDIMKKMSEARKALYELNALEHYYYDVIE